MAPKIAEPKGVAGIPQSRKAIVLAAVNPKRPPSGPCESLAIWGMVFILWVFLTQAGPLPFSFIGEVVYVILTLPVIRFKDIKSFLERCPGKW